MGFICAMMMMLVEMGSALEDPFGSDVTDHPLEKYCKAVELQAAAVAKRHRGGILGADLAVPPSQRYSEVRRHASRLASGAQSREAGELGLDLWRAQQRRDSVVNHQHLSVQ